MGKLDNRRISSVKSESCTLHMIYGGILLTYKSKFECKGMPEISRFYGIIIKMYFNAHNPPHFHIEYQDFEAIMNIETGELTGKISRRALNLVYDWLDQNKEALLENWKRIEERKPLNKIKPLD